MLFTLFLHSPLFAIVLGPLVMLIGDFLQRLIPLYDKAGPRTKQMIAVAMGFVFAILVHFVPSAVPDACGDTLGHGLTDACLAALFSSSNISTFLNAAITGLMAIATKHGVQNAAAAKT